MMATVTGPNNSRHLLRLRAKILAAVRSFFDDRDFLEIETPIRMPAPAPEFHIDAIPSGDWFLQTSPELCMKRLLASGCEKIYQICRCFRQNERGKRHLPEFTMLEWYGIGIDYFDLMDHCQGLLPSVASALDMGRTLTYQGETIDLSPPWPRLTVKEAFEQFGSLTLDKAMKQNRFDEILTESVEPRLGRKQPAFLYDYPAPLGALARCKAKDPSLAERFELYVAGIELCNGFSELTDTQIQRQRFTQEIEARKTSGKSLYPLPEPFLSDLAKVPPAAGNALGIDRLVMLFADTDTIDDVVAFIPEAL